LDFKVLIHRGELSPNGLKGELRIELPENLTRTIDPQAVWQTLAVIDHPRERAILLVVKSVKQIGGSFGSS
jgi:hypothetical protein